MRVALSRTQFFTHHDAAAAGRGERGEERVVAIGELQGTDCAWGLRVAVLAWMGTRYRGGWQAPRFLSAGLGSGAGFFGGLRRGLRV